MVVYLITCNVHIWYNDLSKVHVSHVRVNTKHCTSITLVYHMQNILFSPPKAEVSSRDVQLCTRCHVKRVDSYKENPPPQSLMCSYNQENQPSILPSRSTFEGCTHNVQTLAHNHTPPQMCTLVDSSYSIIQQKGVTCGPCNPFGVAIPVISLKVIQARLHYDSMNHLTWIPPHGRSLPLHLIYL